MKLTPVANVITLFMAQLTPLLAFYLKFLLSLCPQGYKLHQKKFYEIGTCVQFHKKLWHNLHHYWHITLHFCLDYATMGINCIKKSFMKLAPGVLRKFSNLQHQFVEIGTVFLKKKLFLCFRKFYTTFYVRNLQMLVIIYGICTWQAFPAWMLTSKVWLYPQTLSQPSLMFASDTFHLLHSRVGSWPYPQPLDQAGKACQGQTLQLKMNISKLQE